MFERFTDRAIAVIIAAQEESRRLGQSSVGTEEILLGLLVEGASPAARVLKEFGLTLPQTRAQVEKLVGQGSGPVPAEVPFTPRTRQLFEQALQEARQLDQSFVAPEHLLLSLTRDQESAALQVLSELEVEPSKVRSRLIRELGDQAKVPAGGETTTESRRSANKVLDEFGIDLTEQARQGQLDPVVGRETEIERVVQILGRRTKNNPVLIGEPGVGKTAIAEGLAQRIVTGDVPFLLEGKQVISLSLGQLVSGTQMRGAFEERISQLLEEVRRSGNIILMIDELHTLVGAGGFQGGLDASNLLKPALARGELQCIGATTLDEYRKYIEQDAALERRFQPVKVGEPSVEDTIEILFGLRDRYEQHHKLTISDQALAAAAQLSSRYIADRFLPDKAIDLIDEAGSRVRFRHSRQSPQRALRQELQQVTQQKSEAVEAQDFDRASQLRDRELELEQQIKAQQQASDQEPKPIVEPTDIAQVLESWTGIPVKQLSESESAMLLHADANLHERVIGQNEAVTAVSKALRRARVGLQDPNRPIASFIFLGPTGVGKTELTKALAELMFGTKDALIRLDMSEFMEPHTVSKLIGSPPGFIGYDEGGQLTEQVRRRPYSVVLMDEIEKAHPDVFNLMLQILEDGHLTDSQGRKVSFKNTIVIMTSNLGSRAIEKGGGGFGFDFDASGMGSEEAQYARIRERVGEELKQFFRPEFLNRLDDIIVFRQLTREELTQIADLLLQEVADQLQEQRGIELEVTEAFKARVITEGYDPTYGARPLRRTITRLLEDHLAEAMLMGQVKDNSTVVVDSDDDGQIQVQPKQTPVFANAG